MILCFQLLHTSVDSVEKRLTGAGGVVMIRCKDFTRLALDIPTAEDCLNVAASVEQLSNIGEKFCLRNCYLFFKHLSKVVSIKCSAVFIDL